MTSLSEKSRHLKMASRASVSMPSLTIPTIDRVAAQIEGRKQATKNLAAMEDGSPAVLDGQVSSVVDTASGPPGETA